MHGPCRKIGLALIVWLVVSGTAQAQVPKEKAKRQPPRIPDGVKVERDLEYARVGDTPILLDIYRPEKAGEPLPLIVWVHGGGWRNGSKGGSMAIPLSGRGYVVASIDYRLTGVAKFPAQIEDCRAAIRWLRASASKYGIDPKRIGVWGASAGGHLVSLLGTAGDVTTWDSVGGNTDQSSRVQAVCDFYGPSNLFSERFVEARNGGDPPMLRLFGGPVEELKEKARRGSPVTYVSADDPPFLIVHGDKDNLVPINQSEQLEQALKKAGVEATFLLVKNGGHGFGPESEPSPEAIREQVISFFDRHLKAEARTGSSGSGKSE
jgi:acetyl esterase/lipase